MLVESLNFGVWGKIRAIMPNDGALYSGEETTKITLKCRIPFSTLTGPER